MVLDNLPSRDLLISAYRFYLNNNAQAHSALVFIMDRNDMTNAILGCIDYALEQEEPERQRFYIGAACLGMKKYPGDEIACRRFAHACRHIRVMNVCRSLNLDPQIGFDQVLDHLIARRKFKLALWMNGYMKDQKERKIRAKWCEHLIEKRTLSDQQAANKIREILGQNPIVPYADIANKATEYNRIPLAISLIENEGQSAKQIPLLMKLKKYDLVLAQALSSCDSNLIYMAIFKLMETIPNEIQFLELLKKYKLAFRYYLNYLAIADIKKSIMICHKEYPEDELILCLVDNRLESALNVSKGIRRDVIPNQIETSIRLNKFHQTLEGQRPPPMSKQRSWHNLSVCETIINLIAIGKPGMAKDCQKRFDVSERKYKALEQIAMKTLPRLIIPTAQKN